MLVHMGLNMCQDNCQLTKYMTRRVMSIEDGVRGRGRPLTTWTWTIAHDLKALDLTTK